MNWRTARNALEWLLSSGSSLISVEFNGGEPLLEMATLRRAVEFVEANRPPGTRVAYSVTTNGTLLTPEILAFLFEHGFTISISFDGVEAAQRKRGEGTFEVLDRLIEQLREEHAPQLAPHVKILLTLVASTIPYFAESVRYLLGKGVQAIDIAPRLTPDPDWHPSCREDLERTMDEIVRLSLDHWRRTGTVPVSFLAGARPPDASASAGEFLCSVSAATSLSVDPDGRGWACPVFASSLQELAPLAREAGTRLLIENMPFAFLPDAESLMNVVDGYGDDGIRVIYDVANGHFIGESPIQGLQRVRDRLGLVHFSDTTRQSYKHDPLGCGDLPLAGLAAAMKEVGYAELPMLEIISAKPDSDIADSCRRLVEAGFGGAA